MYIRNILSLFFAAIAVAGLSQNGPLVVILSPFAHTFDKVPGKALEKNVTDYRKKLDLVEANAYLKSEEFKERAENIQTTQRSEIAYLAVLDETKIVSYLTEQHLAYLLLEKMKTAVVELKDLTSTGELRDLMRIAQDESASFIINISRFDLSREEGKNYADITVQLLDKNSNSILLDETFTGDDKNPGFEYTCEDGSVNCCINNALSQIVTKVGRLILAHDPGMKKQQQLALEQTELLNALLAQPFDTKVLSEIIPLSDKKIDQKKAFQVLFSPDRTKFVGFFAETVPAAESEKFRDSHKDDKNVNIISEDQTGFFTGKLPNTYAYIVRGVLYKGKWYYEKSDVTYFDAASLDAGKKTFFGYLRKWEFFMEGSSVPDPLFWEGKETIGYTLATKVVFAKTSANDEKYPGIYRIVADQLEKK